MCREWDLTSELTQALYNFIPTSNFLQLSFKTSVNDPEGHKEWRINQNSNNCQVLNTCSMNHFSFFRGGILNLDLYGWKIYFL